MKKRTFVYSENAEYQKQYQHSLHRIILSFNPKNKEDEILWKHLESKENRSGYIKFLIKMDIDRE